jgi:hypothetical protein
MAARDALKPVTKCDQRPVNEKFDYRGYLFHRMAAKPRSAVPTFIA